MPSSSRIPLAVVINSLESGGAENHLLESYRVWTRPDLP